MKFLARAAVAVVWLALLIAVGYIGGWWFLGGIVVLTVLALSEYYSAVQRKGIRPSVGLGWLCAGLILLVTQLEQEVQMVTGFAGDASGGASMEASANVLQLTLFVLVFCVAAVLVGQFKRRGETSAVVNTAVTVFGVVYVGLLFSFVVRMRYVDVPFIAGDETAGEFARRMGGLILVIAPVWLCDTAAFLAGNAWGRIKLAPRISPGKTLEGSAAGLLAAIVVALVVGVWLGLPARHALILGLLMGVVGQLGDLCKSILKRDLGIKDFGALFGPHGGALDRFDAILFSMPLVYWYFWFILRSAGG